MDDFIGDQLLDITIVAATVAVFAPITRALLLILQGARL
jgi:hypothetical protein